MTRPHSLDVLVACLERLGALNRRWTEIGKIHHLHLLESRLDLAAPLLVDMERILLEISDEEEVRMETSLRLAADLEMPDDPPPRLDEIVARLPGPLGEELGRTGRTLKASLLEASELAARIQGVAQIGWRISDSTLAMARKAATASARTPAAYARGGRKTTNLAVPVYQNAWKA